jgi:predicted porin
VSKVGLSGSFGSVDIGRQLTALQGPIGLSDPWMQETVASTFSLTGVPFVAGVGGGYWTDKAQPDNAGLGRADVIAYNSPNLSGFSGAVNYAPRRTAVVPGAGAVNRANNFYSLWGQYAAGPIFVGAGTERNREADKLSAILGSYNFGVAKLMAGYSQVDTVAITGKKGKNYNFGATAPFGVVLAKVGYGVTEVEGSGIKIKKAGAGIEYNLSKRTYLYTSGAKFTQTSATAAKTAFDVGISHSF